MPEPSADGGNAAELIRVRGLVQGVGFRPAVWRLAHGLGLRGSVANDGDGVIIRLCGPAATIARFVQRLAEQPPPLARIDRIERGASLPVEENAGFHIIASLPSGASTGVAPDAATCPECRAEVFGAAERRYRYPFATCVNCGPRLSIIERVPYDRQATTMRRFGLCAACAGEYHAPENRRFHAESIACPACGPRAWLERRDGQPFAPDGSALDDVDAAATLLLRGEIVAIKGLGGFQLACDATNAAAVARLRLRKRRLCKPLALMVRDLDVADAYCEISEAERLVLLGATAPIVLLRRRAEGRPLAEAVAPGVATLGVMLPNTPLHHLLLQRLDRPIVLTSGNLSDAPQCIDNQRARETLGGIADAFLMHDREIARRVDDSIVRVIGGTPRVLRRGRGHAPAALTLPDGSAAAPPVLAMGGELKAAFCLLRDGQAILSQHMGDLEDAGTFADYRQAIDGFARLFGHAPAIIAVDPHPDYVSTQLGRALAAQQRLHVVEVQHHHAHIAACLAENGVAPEAAPVIGVALDGLGFGLDGTLWGGEFLLADYRRCRRLATFRPVAMPGGAQAIREPWRNTYAHLTAAMGWARFARDYGDLPLGRFLQSRPRAVLDGMIAQGLNSPLASSCGRLFDAVAAAAGICRERADYEGQAAAEFEALVDAPTLAQMDERHAYPFGLGRLPSGNLPCLEPRPMWQALLGDLRAETPLPVIAARFHQGLALAIVRMIDRLRQDDAEVAPAPIVALSGGVLQNKVLLELLTAGLQARGLRVLTHAQVPTNDGGLALGQAVVAAARGIPAMAGGVTLA
jgi:hydrogenase maturation protein HypF